MGCRTGFYLLLAGDYSSKDIVSLVIEMYEFIRDFKGEVPGASPKDCGNYLDMNLSMANYLGKKYLDEVLYGIDESRLVGKVNGGFYTHKGVKYPMGQHGFARDNEFECIENTENKTVHRLVSTEETKKVYPFDFAFTVTQELSGRTLTITWKVENTGDDDMYFSVGGHPAFMIPEQYDIVFNKGLENHTETELEYVLIDPETAGVDVAHPRKLKLQDGRIPYTRTLFDEDALIFDNTQVERVGVEVDGKPYVTLTCKGFPSVGVWSKPKADAPFVCLEPWIGRCDNVGFDGELKDKYGEQHLKAGETFQAGYTITIGE